ncbi:MAG: secondary thiamine-phosphate synthase enzyme YjbQ [Nitrospiraceae bacterium]
MSVKSIPLRVKMAGGTQIENITKQVQQALSESSLKAGIVTVFAKHTTASVLIIEDEPGIRADTKTIWDRLIPTDPNWQHNTRNPGEDNAHSHLRGQLQGSSLTVPFNDGTLALGIWQQVVVVDFDTRSRTRDLVLQVIGE